MQSTFGTERATCSVRPEVTLKSLTYRLVTIYSQATTHGHCDFGIKTTGEGSTAESPSGRFADRAFACTTSLNLADHLSLNTTFVSEQKDGIMPTQYEDGLISEKAAGAMDVVTDVVTEVRREAALLKTGALQNAILNSANFSSIATDEKGVIQLFNVGAERMLGYSALEGVDNITPADISDPQEVIARAKAH